MVVSSAVRTTAPRTSPLGRVWRAVVSAHVVAVLGQPVFAGVYLTGDFDALRWHATGADVVTSLGYVQLVVAVVVGLRLRRSWPLLTTLALVAAETVQYAAGMDGALWLHVPLGVLTVAALVVQFIAVWWWPLAPRARAREEVRDA